VLPDLRHRLLGGPPSTFFVLVVGAPKSLSPPPRGPLCISRLLTTPPRGLLYEQDAFLVNFFWVLALSGTWRDVCQGQVSEKPSGEKMCWPHLRVHSLSRGGPRGHCRYPTNRVPPHIGLSPRQGTRHTATCPVAPDPASLLGRAPALPRAPLLRTPPPCSGGL
jgi:hypothetical protein